MTTRRSGENLIPLARELVESIDAPHIIENVPDAADELRNPVPLVGDAFGLEVRKKRLFETSFPAYGAPGNFSLNRGYEFSIGDREHPVEDYREAHGFDRDCSLTAKELREAIPPAYVAHLVEQAERVQKVG